MKRKKGRRKEADSSGILWLVQGDYGQDGDGNWWVRPPGMHIGRIDNRTVLEHEDLMAIPTFNGLTIPVVSIQPDWKVTPVLSLNHKTTVAEAIDLTEERESLAPRCLYGMEFQTLTLTSQESGYLKRVLDLAEDLPVACPLWPMAAKLSAAAVLGATTLAVDDTTGCLFEVFHSHAILWESFLKWEIVELNAVNQFSVTLLAGLTQGYSAAAKLVPIAYGNLSRDSLTGLTDANVEWKCTFMEVFHRLNDQSVPEAVPVDAPLPVADFIAAPLTAPSLYDFAFTNLSTDSESWLWDFGDGETSTDENPVHDYAADGTYTVTLTATGPGGVDVETKVAYLIVADPYDDIESYADGAPLNGLNGGVGYPGPYISRGTFAGAAAADDIESYTDGVALNGLNGGTGWGGPYVDRQRYQDPNDEATSWADYAVPQNGGTVSAATKGYAATFIAALKTAGIRSKILRLNLYAGNQLAACCVPIIRDVGNWIDLKTGFVGGDYSEATGLTGNTSSTKYLNCTIIPSTDLLLNNVHIGYYNRSAVGEAGHPCGCHNSAGTNILRLLCSYSGTTYFAAGAADITVADVNGRGLYLGVQDASERRVYKAGTSINSSASIGGAMPPHAMYFHALNQFGTAANSSARTLAGYTIGKALTGAEVTAFTNAWQAFQTSLSRQV